MLTKEYIESDGKIFEVVGRDGQGRPVTVVTDLKEIPKDEPLPKPEIVSEFTKEMAKSFIDDVKAVEDLLPGAEASPKRRRRKA